MAPEPQLMPVEEKGPQLIPPHWRELLPTTLQHLAAVTSADKVFLLCAADTEEKEWHVDQGVEVQPAVRMPRPVRQQLGRGSQVIHRWQENRPEGSQELLHAVDADSVLLEPIISGGSLWGALGLAASAQNRIWPATEREALRRLATLLGAAVVGDQFASEYELLSLTDELTSTLNRRGITRRASDLTGEKPDMPVAIGFIDVDRFKAVNDTYGHAAGDQALTAICDTCRAILREEDDIGRWGGDELLIILPGTSRSQAHGVLSRIREAVSQLQLPSLPEAALSLSVGVAMYPEDGESFLSLVEAADERLYKAKKLGGDAVVSGALLPKRRLAAVR